MRAALRRAAYALAMGMTMAGAHGALAQGLAQIGPMAGGPALTPSDSSGHAVHIFPVKSLAVSQVSRLAGPALAYHGGPIMPTIAVYSIFWAPPTLQNGAPALLPAHYQSVALGLATDYAGHTISSNNTQYYQTLAGVTTYVSGLSSGPGVGGSFGGAYVDATPFPASGCTDTATPGNCLTDAQIQAEIANVMALNGWTGGLDKMFLLYTAKGEGSCFDSTSTSCAYTQFCAYHGYFGVGPIVYGNEPYGDVAHCQTSGTPSPTGDAAADTAMTAASHELTEAITDPELNAWYSANGSEIGDICAYNYGTAIYLSGHANQFWNGRYYELQREYDNRSASCVQVGP